VRAPILVVSRLVPDNSFLRRPVIGTPAGTRSGPGQRVDATTAPLR
jgi:hypothetical protein